MRCVLGGDRAAARPVLEGPVQSAQLVVQPEQVRRVFERVQACEHAAQPRLQAAARWPGSSKVSAALDRAHRVFAARSVCGRRKVGGLTGAGAIVEP